VFLARRSGVGETLLGQIEDFGRQVLEGLGLRAGKTVLQRFKETLAEIHDSSIEWLAADGIPRALWSEMKEAEGRTEGPGGGLALAAEALARLRDSVGDLELHLAGHSAGSILLGGFCSPLADRGLGIASLHLLAPACTMDFAARTFGSALGRGRRAVLDRRRVAIRVLSDRNERRDHVGPYGKSLLYLVSRALERRRRTPLLGLEAAWDPSVAPEREPVDLDDPGRLRWLELWSDGPPPEVLREPQVITGPTSIPAGHRAFDNSVEVVNAILRTIVCEEPEVPASDLTGF
jgi:pimeloyl-ACP methyl ester carboxylesterase